MPLIALEQWFPELMNRARLDPLGEAARYDTDLNQGVTGTPIAPDVTQVPAHGQGPIQYLRMQGLSSRQNSVRPWPMAHPTLSHHRPGTARAQATAQAAPAHQPAMTSVGQWTPR